MPWLSAVEIWAFWSLIIALYLVVGLTSFVLGILHRAWPKAARTALILSGILLFVPTIWAVLILTIPALTRNDVWP
jgi:hypothetical protein